MIFRLRLSTVASLEDEAVPKLVLLTRKNLLVREHILPFKRLIITEKGGKKKIAELLLLEMYLLTVIVCTFSIDNYWDSENM